MVIDESLPEPSYPEIERILISKKCIKSRVDALAKIIAREYSKNYPNPRHSFSAFPYLSFVSVGNHCPSCT